MTFRSRTNSDQRRRRVLLDETRHEEPRATVAPPSGKRNKRYPDDALNDAQLRITDFLPHSTKALAFLLTALTVSNTGIIALHWFAQDWQAKFPQLPLGVLEATSSSGLAQFALIWQLLLIQAGCCLIFAIRRRRLDDLRGTYQVWIWATMVAGIGILLAATDVSELVAYGVSCIPKIPALGHPRYYLWAALAVLALPLKIRLLIEIRRVRTAQVLLVGSMLLFAVREILLMQWIELPEKIASTTFAGATLLSTTLLLAALFFYGRYVKMDAMGAFSKKKTKKRKKIAAEEEKTEEGQDTKSRQRIDAGSSSVPRPNSIGAAINSARTKDPDEDEDRPAGPLSKANRKAMRR